MGTRSLTFVYSEVDEPIINMYGQWDGYPEYHGLELAKFLTNGKFVNGISTDDKNIFNGMECLAARLVSSFKIGPGGFYLYPVSATECYQDYEYHIYKDKVVVTDGRDTLFEGSYAEFKEYCKNKVKESA